MKADIILAGVGGQGILSIASIIGGAAIEQGLYLKQAETHGMSQRGGAVVSHLRISDKPIASDLISQGQADMIISVEPMESLRYLPFLKKNGWVVTNTTPVKNISNYPKVSDILDELKKLPHHVTLNAEGIAIDVGNPKASNIVMLGASSPFLGIDKELIVKNICTTFERKGEVIVNRNVDAYKAGEKIAKRYLKNQ